MAWVPLAPPRAGEQGSQHSTGAAIQSSTAPIDHMAPCFDGQGFTSINASTIGWVPGFVEKELRRRIRGGGAEDES
eukprot:3070848-Rhodomonas_salina.2